MKRLVLSFAINFLIICLCFSQEIINYPIPESNENIQQISGVDLANVIGLQDLNFGLTNPSIILQLGNQNKLSVKQTNQFEGKNNQTLNFQIGNYNELTLDQIGHGNLLLSFQMGYLALENLHRVFDLYGANKVDGENSPAAGDNNKIKISQQGYENGILAVQQGNNNFISADQNGNNNYLRVLQKGNDNSVTDYRQENNLTGTLFDSIIQEGENLSVTTDGFPKTRPSENVFSQTGTNLSIEVHNEFLEPTGGLKVFQNGTDMKITVDQSYFPDPLR